MAHTFVKVESSSMENAGQRLFYFCDICCVMADRTEIWADITARPFTYVCDKCKETIEKLKEN